MPRVNIGGRRVALVPNDNGTVFREEDFVEGKVYPEGTHFRSENQIGLHWTRGDFATTPQLSLTFEMEWLAVYVDEWRKNGEVQPGDRGSVYATFNTRREINDMITALRKMRDSAFGRDA